MLSHRRQERLVAAPHPAAVAAPGTVASAPPGAAAATAATATETSLPRSAATMAAYRSVLPRYVGGSGLPFGHRLGTGDP
jgi:hypothetical protein